MVRRMFEAARFVGHLGVELVGVGPGWCESALPWPAPQLEQQNGFLHAGVLATMADHTAGGALVTLLPAGQGVLSIEFKINMLRPASGALRCRAEVLRRGRSIGVVESSVYAKGEDAEEELVSRSMVTLAIVDLERLPAAR
jgi:uncharacterized protein (TIGR00369 family)